MRLPVVHVRVTITPLLCTSYCVQGRELVFSLLLCVLVRLLLAIIELCSTLGRLALSSNGRRALRAADWRIAR
jgi:hypothetical protein